MTKHKLLFICCTVILGLGLAVPQAKATLWYLNDTNVDLGLSGRFASVDINVVGHSATFTVEANQALFGAGSNFGIDKFFFDTKLSTITSSDFASQSGWTVKTNKNSSSFGTFVFEYKGTGNVRTDLLTFTITDSSITSAMDFYEANADGHHFAAHIGGFTDQNGETSAFVTDGDTTSAPVPEPATLFLLGSGLAGLSFWRRKSKM